MAKAQTLRPRDGFLAALGIALAANYFSVQLLAYPFLYCWTAWWLGPLYLSWGSILLYISLLWVIYALFRKTFIQVLIGCGLFMAVIELPGLMDYLIRQGGSCG